MKQAFTRIFIGTENTQFNHELSQQIKNIFDIEAVCFTTSFEFQYSDYSADENTICILDSEWQDQMPQVFERFFDESVPIIALTPKLDKESYLKLSELNLLDFHYMGHPKTVESIVHKLHQLQVNLNRTILIVDDSKTMRRILKRQLVMQRFQVIEADDGTTGFQSVVKENPTMILTDYNMTHMNGVEFILKIREYYTLAELPIIGLSANDAPHLAAEFIRSGANDFLPKPPKMDELFCRIYQNLELLDRSTELKFAAERDYLTKLYNRRAFFSKAKIFIQQKTRYLTMVDLDFFKNINDTYGHEAGDYILESTARIMESIIKPTDIIARFGGEEFVFLFGCDSDEEALQMMERFRNILESTTFKYEGNDLKMTASMGLVKTVGAIAHEKLSSEKSSNEKPNPEQVLNQSLVRADELVYEAKAQGRNRIKFS